MFSGYGSAYSSDVFIYVALWLIALYTPWRDQPETPQPDISLVNHTNQNWNALFFLFLFLNVLFWSKNKIPGERVKKKWSWVTHPASLQQHRAVAHRGEKASLHRQKKQVLQGHTTQVMFHYSQKANGFCIKVHTQGWGLGWPFWDFPHCNWLTHWGFSLSTFTKHSSFGKGSERQWGKMQKRKKVASFYFSGYYLLSHFQHCLRAMGIHGVLCVDDFFGLYPRSLLFSENKPVDLFLFSTA